MVFLFTFQERPRPALKGLGPLWPYVVFEENGSMYHITVLHAHTPVQAIGQALLAQGSNSTVSIPEAFRPCQYLQSDTPRHLHLNERQDDKFNSLLDALVSIEKKHWAKSQSWGDQFRRLTVHKQNAYVFILLAGDFDDGNILERGMNDGKGNIVGYCVMYLNTLHGQLSKLWVTQEERNKGCATFLVRYAIEYVKALVTNKVGYSILLFVETGNTPAIKVYSEKLGFSIEEPVLLDYYHNGSHAYRMRLEI